jgi:S-formylglutathione hydrolase FrmB
VLPQGEDGWYVDSPARPADRYAAYLGEVVAWAEKTLPISRAPARTGITGWSMGGYGAVRYAEGSGGRFGFVASIIGLLDYPRAETLPDGRNYKVAVARFTDDPAVWARFNPLHGIGALRGSALTLVLATRGFELTMNENFLAALAAQNIPARVHRLEGGHEFPLVERAVPLVLADATDFFQKKPAAP